MQDVILNQSFSPFLKPLYKLQGKWNVQAVVVLAQNNGCPIVS